MTTDGPHTRHLHPVEPPWDPEYDGPPDPPDTPTTDRRPPHNREAEQAVLGALLIAPHLLTDHGHLLAGTDFYDPRHETVWDAIHTVAAGDRIPDPVLVMQHLTATGELQRVGGAAYLHDLMAACPIPEQIEHYAGVVRETSRRRRTLDILARATQAAREGDDDYLATLTAFDQLEQHLLNHTPTHLPPSTWAPVDLTSVLAGEHLDPPPTMLRRADGIPLVYDGAVHTISGESESGKTWLTLLSAVQLLADGDHVTFVDFEDRADRVVSRLCALGAHPDQVRNHFTYIRPDRPLDDDGRRQIEPALTGTRLVVLDGVTEAMTMHGFDLNSNSDSATFQALLPRWIADHGPAVVMIDHVVKDKEKQDRFALGAQHKLAGIDGAAYIVKMLQPFGRGKRGLARVDVAKDRPGHVREHTFGRTIAEFTLDATHSDEVLVAHLLAPGEASGRKGDTFEPTHLMEKISRAVQLTPGLSKKAIEDLVNGKTPSKRLALELLVTRGYIVTKQGPRGAIQHFHHKAYFEADPDNPDTPESED